MRIKSFLLNLGKLLLGGIMYFVGFMLGAMLATGLRLPPPPMPEGISQSSAGIALISSLFSGLIIAIFYPPLDKSRDFASAWKTFFAQKCRGEWWWRLLLAAVAFMPVYLLSGYLVRPFIGNYYIDGMFGLKAAGWSELLPVLLLRSFLFLLVCLPIIVTWQGSSRSLFFRLGTSLFILVGLLYMLTAYWLPLNVRIPHTIEILLDSFAYSGVLICLLTKRPPKQRASSMNL